MAAETAAERLVRDVASQSANRKARNYEDQPYERLSREYVDESVGAATDDLADYFNVTP